jgi:hypothetical protein
MTLQETFLTDKTESFSASAGLALAEANIPERKTEK